MQKEGIFFEMVCYSPNFIHGCLVGEGYGQECLLTRVYGLPEASRRPFFWYNLKGSIPVDEILWMVFRDFNKILFHSEKQGGTDCHKKQLEDFRDALAGCDL